MATTLNNSGVTFPDGTTQTTAASGTSTAAVLNATAGASVGAVGTYAWLWSTSTTTVSAGGTLAGSSLRYAGFSWRQSGTVDAFEAGGSQSSWRTMGNGGTPAGTWRAMGRSWGFSSIYENYYGMTLWLRIS